VVHVDERPGEAVLDQLRQQKGVKFCWAVELE
jgi:hypothetical protein